MKISIRPYLDFWPFVKEATIYYHSHCTRLSNLLVPRQPEVMTEENHNENGTKEDHLTWWLQPNDDAIIMRVGTYDYKKGGLQTQTWYGFTEFEILSLTTKAGVVLKTHEDIMEFLRT